MILLNPKLLSILKKVFNFAFALRVIPFKWNPEHGVIGLVNARYTNHIFYRWEVMICLCLVHSIYISIVFCYNLSQINLSRISYETLIFLQGVYVICFWIAFTLYIAMIQFQTYLPTILNQFLVYFQHIQGLLNFNILIY